MAPSNRTVIPKEKKQEWTIENQATLLLLWELYDFDDIDDFARFFHAMYPNFRLAGYTAQHLRDRIQPRWASGRGGPTWRRLDRWSPKAEVKKAYEKNILTLFANLLQIIEAWANVLGITLAFKPEIDSNPKAKQRAMLAGTANGASTTALSPSNGDDAEMVAGADQAHDDGPTRIVSDQPGDEGHRNADMSFSLHVTSAAVNNYKKHKSGADIADDGIASEGTAGPGMEGRKKDVAALSEAEHAVETDVPEMFMRPKQTGPWRFKSTRETTAQDSFSDFISTMNKESRHTTQDVTPQAISDRPGVPQKKKANVKKPVVNPKSSIPILNSSTNNYINFTPEQREDIINRSVATQPYLQALMKKNQKIHAANSAATSEARTNVPPKPSKPIDESYTFIMFHHKDVFASGGTVALDDNDTDYIHPQSAVYKYGGCIYNLAMTPDDYPKCLDQPSAPSLLRVLICTKEICGICNGNSHTDEVLAPEEGFILNQHQGMPIVARSLLDEEPTGELSIRGIIKGSAIKELLYDEAGQKELVVEKVFIEENTRPGTTFSKRIKMLVYEDMD